MEVLAGEIVESPLDEAAPGALLLGWTGRGPKEILAEAAIAAKELDRVITATSAAISLGSRDKPSRHLKVEAWTTVARFYGVAVRTSQPRFVSYDTGGEKPVRGFEVTAEAVMVSTGVVISTATSMCMSDEEKWGERPKYVWEDQLDANGKKIWDAEKRRYKSARRQAGTENVPLFQLASMAATRATGKVCRNLFSWVVVLAGYSPTPAEEMDGALPVVDTTPQVPPPDPRPAEPKAPDGPLVAAETWVDVFEPKKTRSGKETWKVTLRNGRVVWTDDPEVAAVVSSAKNTRIVLSTRIDDTGFEHITSAGPA